METEGFAEGGLTSSISYVNLLIVIILLEIFQLLDGGFTGWVAVVTLYLSMVILDTIIRDYCHTNRQWLSRYLFWKGRLYVKNGKSST